MKKNELKTDENKNKIEYKYYLLQDEQFNIEEVDITKEYSEYSDSELEELYELYDNIESCLIYEKSITSRLFDIKNIKKFPYIAIGFLRVKFPLYNKTEFFYTCFAIGGNIVVTLASNLIDKNKGGKAISILTSFSEDKVKWENVYIENEYESKGKEDLESNNNSLAAILYEDIVNSEWIGIEKGNPEDFIGKDIYTTFCINENIDDEDENEEKYNYKKRRRNKKSVELRQIKINEGNPFRKLETEEEKIIGEKVPGSPIYYRDFNKGVYAIAIVNSSFEFQYFNDLNLSFLKNMKRKIKPSYNIIKLDMAKQNLNPVDIKVLKIHNLKILDLSYNSIGIQGAFYLSNGIFNSLESLNLNGNEINDKGVLNISNCCFPELKSLYLINNNISDKGIKYLISAKFISNLTFLSLDENEKIGIMELKS